MPFINNDPAKTGGASDSCDNPPELTEATLLVVMIDFVGCYLVVLS